MRRASRQRVHCLKDSVAQVVGGEVLAGIAAAMDFPVAAREPAVTGSIVGPVVAVRVTDMLPITSELELESMRIGIGDSKVL